MKKRNGFTLLELIAVMGIIVALSSVIVSGFSVMARMLARKSGTEAIVKAVKLARQHACIDGRDTYFYITDHNSYVICRRGGTIAMTERKRIQDYIDGNEYTGEDGFDPDVYRHWIFDKYSDLGGATERFGVNDLTGANQNATRTYRGTMIYNLSSGNSAELTVSPWYSSIRGAWVFGLLSQDASNFPAEYTDDDGIMQRTVYGWIIYPEQRLPKGYAFMVNGGTTYASKPLLANDPQYIMFDTSGNAWGAEGGEPMNIFIRELAQPEGKGIYRIEIKGNGSVSVPDNL